MERNRKRHEYTAEEVRQGQIVLKSPTSKIVFIGGLVLFIAFAFLLPFLV